MLAEKKGGLVGELADLEETPDHDFRDQVENENRRAERLFEIFSRVMGECGSPGARKMPRRAPPKGD